MRKIFILNVSDKLITIVCDITTAVILHKIHCKYESYKFMAGGNYYSVKSRIFKNIYYGYNK